MFDFDGDGHLNDGEMSDEEIFNYIDQDNNGYISLAEFGHAMSIFGHNPDMIDEEVKKELREADIDGNGQINFEEFVAGMDLLLLLFVDT